MGGARQPNSSWRASPWSAVRAVPAPRAPAAPARAPSWSRHRSRHGDCPQARGRRPSPTHGPTEVSSMHDDDSRQDDSNPRREDSHRLHARRVQSGLQLPRVLGRSLIRPERKLARRELPRQLGHHPPGRILRFKQLLSGNASGRRRGFHQSPDWRTGPVGFSSRFEPAFALAALPRGDPRRHLLVRTRPASSSSRSSSPPTRTSRRSPSGSPAKLGSSYRGWRIWSPTPRPSMRCDRRRSRASCR